MNSDTLIEHLAVSTRLKNHCRRSGITTLGALAADLASPRPVLTNRRGFGAKCLAECRRILEERE